MLHLLPANGLRSVLWPKRDSILVALHPPKQPCLAIEGSRMGLSLGAQLWRAPPARLLPQKLCDHVLTPRTGREREGGLSLQPRSPSVCPESRTLGLPEHLMRDSCCTCGLGPALAPEVQVWATDSSKQVSISNQEECGDTGREAGGGDARARRRVLFQAEGREACRDLKKGKSRA